jgi:hypothetical protein
MLIASLGSLALIQLYPVAHQQAQLQLLLMILQPRQQLPWLATQLLPLVCMDLAKLDLQRLGLLPRQQSPPDLAS